MPEPSPAVVDILSQAIKECPSAASTLELWSLGGAVGRVGIRDTPFALRQAPVLLGIEANWDGIGEAAANITWARGVYKEMQRFAYAGSYLNFPGLLEEREAILHGTFGENYRRLLEIKTRYDPFNLFHNNVNIPVS
jgi:hypothetical protein